MSCSPKLRTKQQPPYGGGFSLNVPEKGFVGKGNWFEMLFKNVVSYRRANGLVCGLGLEDEIEQEICVRYPNECDCVDARIPRLPVTIGVKEIAAGTSVLLPWKLSGGRPVDRAEAERRAAICAQCPLNKAIATGCVSCGSLLGELAKQLVGNLTTPLDNRLSNCAICRCFISVMIWIPLEPQWKPLTAEQKEQFAYAAGQFGCWKFVQT